MGNYCIWPLPINNVGQPPGICSDMIYSWFTFVIAIRLGEADFLVFKIWPQRIFKLACFSAKVAKPTHH